MDSTSVVLPESFKNTYKGCGGSGSASAAAIKIQLQLDVLTGGFINFDISRGASNGADYLPTLEKSIEANIKIDIQEIIEPLAEGETIELLDIYIKKKLVQLNLLGVACEFNILVIKNNTEKQFISTLIKYMIKPQKACN